MSTILDFLKKTRKRNFFWWLKYYWNEFLITLYAKKETKIDDSWKGIKISKSEYPINNYENLTEMEKLELFGKMCLENKLFLQK